MHNIKNTKYLIITTLLCLYGALFYAKRINLPASDLGRHITNGKIILSDKRPIATNLYSYTYPDRPFINHHWGFGALSFVVHEHAGFSGLTFMNIALSTLTIALILFAGNKTVSFPYTVVSFSLMLPLIVYRTEVRPEVFSSLFVVLLVVLIQAKLRPAIKLSIIFLIQVLWVNIHIFFVLGFLVTGIFLIANAVYKNLNQVVSFTIVLIVQILASLINPYGSKGLEYPLQILTNYGYRIAENQSPFLLVKIVPEPIYYFQLVLAALYIAISLMAIKTWKSGPTAFATHLLALILLAGSVKMVRLMPYFGIFGLLSLSRSLSYLTPKLSFAFRRLLNSSFALTAIGALVACVAVVVIQSNLYNPFKFFGVGLAHGAEKSAMFFKDNKLQGPIFNNYDIGGYLVYYLYPAEEVFVDNRPEAYPPEFFTDIYIPMQEDEELWQKYYNLYNFNVIYFYRHDYTPWAQPFLIRRLRDPDWAPIFVDDYTLIMIRRNPQNQNIIDRYELPPATFLISH